MRFIPITKVDIAQRLVYGVACDETPDRQGEIWDYASSKPLWEAWSKDMAAKSDGKSLGNLRAMHTSIAAGKLTSVDYDDATKSIAVCAKVVDDAEWEKVEQGVYTGFSTGGKYVRKWTDPANKSYKRVTINPTELSLADLPANPSSVFDAIKVDGTVEQRAFKVAAEEPKKKNPKKFAAAVAAKSMWTVSSLAQMLESLAYMQESIEAERDREDDGSDMPERFAAAVETIAELFLSMAQEETMELVETILPATQGEKAMTLDQIKKQVEELRAKKTAAAGAIEEFAAKTAKMVADLTAMLEDADIAASARAFKAGAAISKANMDKLGAAHKMAHDLREHIGGMMGDKAPSYGDAGKAVAADLDEAVLEVIAGLSERLELAEKAVTGPKAAGAGAEVVVDKEAEVTGKEADKKPKDAMSALKAAKSAPMAYEFFQKASHEQVKAVSGV